MKSTITDVARHAGVSIKTVSRVLNDEPNVTEKTREKVRASAKELRYRPNFSARSLAGSRSFLLAMVYDSPSIEYITHVQSGATSACRARGYHLVVEPVDWDTGDLTNDVELLLERMPVDGVILPAPICDSRRIVSALEKARIPMVRICPRDDMFADIPSLKLDDTAAAFDMTTWLISQGHSDIAFLRGANSHISAHLRERGFRDALEAAGLSVDPSRIADGDYTFESGITGAKALLSQDTQPTAIFASNDDMAAGVISHAGSIGLSVPADISVCGFDDTALASMIFPPLTTVRQPISEMGRRAAQILIDGDVTDSNGLKQDRLVMEYEIVVRGSTRPIGANA